MNTSQRLVIEIHQVATPKDGIDASTLAPAAIAAGVAIFGWIVVERYARARERRADLRALSVSFRETVDDVIADATKYYQIAGGTPEAAAFEASIKSKLALLPDQLRVIGNAGVSIDVREQMKQFRQAVTGGTFEAVKRKPSRSGADIFVKIAAAGQHLNRSVQLTLFGGLVGAKRTILPRLRNKNP